MKGIFKALSYAFHGSCTDIKTCFSRIFFPKCNKPIVKWYKPHGAIHVALEKIRFSAVSRNFAKADCIVVHKKSAQTRVPRFARPKELNA